jgi:hypothetical protein
MPALFTTMLKPPSPSAQLTSSSAVARWADVTGNRDRLRTAGSADGDDLVDDVGSIQRRGNVVDDDGGTGAGQADRLRPAQTRGGTRHHRDLPVQIDRRTSSVGPPCRERGPGTYHHDTAGGGNVRPNRRWTP